MTKTILDLRMKFSNEIETWQRAQDNGDGIEKSSNSTRKLKAKPDK